MSGVSGRFVLRRGGFGEHSSGFEGQGSIRYDGSRLVFSASRRRDSLATAIAIGVALVVLFASSIFITFGRGLGFDEPVVPGLIVVVVSGATVLGARRVALALFGHVRVETAVDAKSIARLTVEKDGLEILSSVGLTFLRTDDASRFAEELAHRPGGYR